MYPLNLFRVNGFSTDDVCLWCKEVIKMEILRGHYSQMAHKAQTCEYRIRCKVYNKVAAMVEFASDIEITICVSLSIDQE